jgi:uncharacterized protein YdhG (YjbR/CyaY superfamily)
MDTQIKKIHSVDEYIKTFPIDIQDILEQIRTTIHEVAPDAEEHISYQMPAFKLKGKYIVHFSAWKNHIGFYPIPSGTPEFQKEIEQYKSSKSTIRFLLEKPIPFDVIKKIVFFRMKEQHIGTV